MSVSHSTLTGTDLHEPKGVAAASAGDVYKADGLGGGAWAPPGGATTVSTYFNANLSVTTLTAGAPGAWTVIAGTQLIGVNLGSWTLTAGNDGLIIPATGTYQLLYNASVKTNGTDKYWAQFDWGLQAGATGAIVANNQGPIERYLDKAKTGALGTHTIFSANAGDAVYPIARLQLVDTGAAAPLLYVDQLSTNVILLA